MRAHRARTCRHARTGVHAQACTHRRCTHRRARLEVRPRSPHLSAGLMERRARLHTFVPRHSQSHAPPHLRKTHFKQAHACLLKFTFHRCWRTDRTSRILVFVLRRPPPSRASSCTFGCATASAYSRTAAFAMLARAKSPAQRRPCAHRRPTAGFHQVVRRGRGPDAHVDHLRPRVSEGSARQQGAGQVSVRGGRARGRAGPSRRDLRRRGGARKRRAQRARP
eukprot:1340661-Pleurochrysis_carterae.AAC.1